jgi:hypothetical protein
MPGVAKIGATARNPADRLAEANASDTWRPPRPYVAVCAVEVADPFASERAVHALLAARRVRHEFFEITELEARVLLSLLAQNEQPQTYTVAAPPAPAQIAEGPDPPAPVATLRLWSPEGKLRAWVESNYTHVPLREKDTGTKLEAIYTAYTTASPPVHTRVLGRNTFAHMLNGLSVNAPKPHKHARPSLYCASA